MSPCAMKERTFYHVNGNEIRESDLLRLRCSKIVIRGYFTDNSKHGHFKTAKCCEVELPIAFYPLMMYRWNSEPFFSDTLILLEALFCSHILKGRVILSISLTNCFLRSITMHFISDPQSFLGTVTEFVCWPSLAVFRPRKQKEPYLRSAEESCNCIQLYKKDEIQGVARSEHRHTKRWGDRK